MGMFWLPFEGKVIAVVVTLLWAIFSGATILIVFPPKLIVTGFGTILGMSGSEISSGAGVISTLNGKFLI